MPPPRCVHLSRQEREHPNVITQDEVGAAYKSEQDRRGHGLQGLGCGGNRVQNGTLAQLATAPHVVGGPGDKSNMWGEVFTRRLRCLPALTNEQGGFGSSCLKILRGP